MEISDNLFGAGPQQLKINLIKNLIYLFSVSLHHNQKN
jgi:hypothetical protein